MATEDEDWAERVCSKEWEVRSRPCAWFKGGRDCHRLWVDFASPAPYIVLACSLCNTFAMTGILMHSCCRHRENHAIKYCLALFACQTVLAFDINGDFNTLPTVVRFGLSRMVRFFVDCTMYEIGVSYRGMLGALTGMPLSSCVTQFELCSLQGLTFCYATFVSTAELLFVPPEGRAGCHFKMANVFYHLGTASTELTFCAYTLWIAAAARSHVSYQIRAAGDQVDESLVVASRAVKIMTNHLRAIAGLFALIFIYTSFVVASRAEPGYLCQQPSCNPTAYVRETLWFIFYNVGGWLGVAMLYGESLDLPNFLEQARQAHEKDKRKKRRRMFVPPRKYGGDDGNDDSGVELPEHP